MLRNGQQDTDQTTRTAAEDQQQPQLQQQPQQQAAPTGEADNSGSVPQQDQQPQERIFGQSQVSAMMAREKAQGRNSVYSELGIDPNDTELIAMVKSFTSARTSVEQIENNQNVETRILEAEHRAVVAEMKAEALAQGAGPQYVDDVVTLAMSKLDADDKADFKTVLGEIRGKYPSLFNDSQEKKDESIGSKGTGTSVNSAQQSGEKNKGAEFGTRLAAQRRSRSQKSNFWNN